MGITSHYGHVYLDRRRIGQMALHGTTPAKMAKAINTYTPFKIGNVSAKRWITGEWPSMGRLPMEYINRLNSDNEDHDVYVVYSYATPIGWVKLDGNDNWVIPDTKYSPTTTNHQSTLRSITR
jgi:hypothetical protein